MRDIESILLTYENINRIEYQYCADFFRLLGVYVCENLRDKDGSEEIDRDRYNFTKKYDIRKRDGGEELIDCLKEAVKRAFELDSIDGWIDELISLYDDRNLMQASCTLQYYYKMKKEEKVSEAGKIFEAAEDEIISIEQKYMECLENRHFLYAKLYCKQKANYAKYHYDESYVYFIDDLTEEGVQILKKFSDFSNVWVLLGLIYESSDKKLRDASDAFEQALEMIGDKPYAASVHYWLGRVYERNSSLQLRSENSYRRANKIIDRYRNVYKVASFEYNHEHWEEALLYFSKCIEKIEKKKGYLDPLEQEYYFKACVRMSLIYLKVEDYRNAIIKAVSALRLRDEIIGGKREKNYIKFYDKMFGQEDAQIYIDLTIKKMRPKNAYRYLAKACQECGLNDDAEIYWDLYREWL